MNERDIFIAARQLRQAAERDAYLDQSCAGDQELRRRIVALLEEQAQLGSFLEHDKPPAVTIDNPLTERAGTVIGQYKLLQKIGEGGFGVVYMAEQEKPVRRMVAVKIIKPGMDTAQVIARFESERQALAIMDHPNIAKVLDAGATRGEPGGVNAGRPYFVMELVKGVPITEFCDKNHMPADQRLKLFIDVCHAIQHAHHKGVIHRDIKPSNVMVTLHDGVPVVKVIDFGVAKATVHKLTEKTLFTAYGQMVGTPTYMSPEQAEMSGLDIDTRSDIYSLGVLLYELLTGTTPLEAKRLREAGYAEVQRLIREEEPPRPSTRLSSLRDSATIFAGNRGTDVRHLCQLLKGDLDWIVMKALEKDRNRRYGTPGDFAADLERHLRHDAILARPPSSAYKLKKFAQRNRAAVLTAGAILTALLVGTGVATWQAIVATRAKQDALAAAEAEKEARQAAQDREAETRAVLDFVESKVLAAARPEGQSGGLGRDVTLRKAVEAALPFVEKRFVKQPLIEARLRLTLGITFHYLGETRLAAEQHAAARALYAQHRGPDHPDTLTSTHNLANSYAALGRHPEALKLHEETLALRKAKLGFAHPDTLSSMNGLALNHAARGWHTEALKLREEALTILKAKLGPDHPDTLLSMNNLANTYADLGRRAEALKLREETLALQKAKLGPDHPDTLMSMNNLANSCSALGRHEEALKLREDTLALQKVKLGADHPDTLGSMHNLASSYAALGRHVEALKLREETLALRKAKLGPDHPSTLLSMNNLANSCSALGRHVEALKLREDTVALQKAKVGADHPNTLLSMTNLANNYAALGRHAEALKLREETLALQKAKLGPEHPDTLRSMNNLASSYDRLGRHAEALKLFEVTLALMKAKLGPDHPDTLGSMSNLAMTLATIPDAKLRDPQRAVQLATRATDAAPQAAEHRGTLGAARYCTGDWKGAIADLEQAISLRKPDDPVNANLGFFLAMAHWQFGDMEKARTWFATAVDWMEQTKLQDVDTKRFRSQAAELLGVQNGP